MPNILNANDVDAGRKLVWMVELFINGKSDGWWTGVPKTEGGWLTRTAWAAKQYTESEAKAVADALDYFPAPMRWSHWVATEHVFIKGEYSRPAIEPIKTSGGLKALELYYAQKDGCKFHNPGVGKICLECVADALDSVAGGQ